MHTRGRQRQILATPLGNPPAALSVRAHYFAAFHDDAPIIPASAPFFETSK